MKVIAYSPDLMDRSRFRDLAEEAEVEFVSSVADLAETKGDVAVGDLGRPGVAQALASSPSARRIGFLSHIDSAGRAEAQALGIEVYPRSRFFSRLVTVVTHSGQKLADTDD